MLQHIFENLGVYCTLALIVLSYLIYIVFVAEYHSVTGAIPKVYNIPTKVGMGTMESRGLRNEPVQSMATKRSNSMPVTMSKLYTNGFLR